MNVDAIIRQVCAIADYDPEEDGYRRLVRGFLSTQYAWLMALKPWTFARRHVDLVLRPDYTTGAVTVTGGSNTVNGAATVWDETINSAEILLPDGNWYKIRRRVNTTQLLLTTNYGGANAAAQTYTIRWRYIGLPADLCDFEGIAARGSNRRTIHYLSPAEEREVVLSEDDTGPAARFTDAEAYQPRPPDEALTATDVTTGGTLLPDTLYRYCYTWKVHGVQTAPSPVVEVTTSSVANHSVDLANFQEIGTGQNGASIYKAVGEGPFYFWQEVSGVSTFSDDGSAAVDKDSPLIADGRSQRVRFWPRTTTAETVDLEYHSSGRPLYYDTDTPDLLPKEFHKVLVDLTLVSVFNRNGDVSKASFYNKRAMEVVEDLIQRKLDHDINIAVRERWTDGGKRVYNTGPIRKV